MTLTEPEDYDTGHCCDDCATTCADVERMAAENAQLRRDLEAMSLRADHFAARILRAESALAAEQKAHEQTRQALGYAAEQCSKANARADRLKAALLAVWDYEESVQRNLKDRGEVSDGTMHKQLRALELRRAALSSEPAQPKSIKDRLAELPELRSGGLAAYRAAPTTEEEPKAACEHEWIYQGNDVCQCLKCGDTLRGKLVLTKPILTGRIPLPPEPNSE